MALGALAGALDVPVVLVDPVVGVLTMPFEDVARPAVVVEPVGGLLEGLATTGCTAPVVPVVAG